MKDAKTTVQDRAEKLESEVARELKRHTNWSAVTFSFFFDLLVYVAAGIAIAGIFLPELAFLLKSGSTVIEDYNRSPEFSWENIEKFGPLAISGLMFVALLRRYVPAWLEAKRWKEVYKQARDLVLLAKN